MSYGTIYKIKLSKEAVKDLKLIKAAKLDNKVKKILKELEIDPYNKSNNYEALKYNLLGKHSKRISYQHRLVYIVDEKNKIIIISRMWTHYEKIK